VLAAPGPLFHTRQGNFRPGPSGRVNFFESDYFALENGAVRKLPRCRRSADVKGVFWTGAWIAHPCASPFTADGVSLPKGRAGGRFRDTACTAGDLLAPGSAPKGIESVGPTGRDKNSRSPNHRTM